MYLQKVISRKAFLKKSVFVGILKNNDESGSIISQAWIRGSGFTPTSHGSTTLA
jgi:hypothetical protein